MYYTPIVNLVNTLLQLFGSLAFLLMGMKMMSDGIQKSAGERLQKALGFMTGNRFSGFFTGLILTIIIQSSGATTAMEVSFVNAGLMTLTQSVGVTLGANIGTTITAWIVALFGFNFKISAFAIPIFGVGYYLSTVKKLHKEPLGEAIMGFGMLFIGLSWLSDTFDPKAGTLNFLQQFSDMGIWSIVIGLIVGALITALIHSSSAESAIVITMAYNQLIGWEFAAALVIGSNVGSTIDAILASLGSNAEARRTALVHFLFNVATVIIACIFFVPFLNFIDIIVPGTPMENITIHIAMLHTVLKTITSIVCLPFTTQIAHIAELLIKDDEKSSPDVYKLEFSETGGKENAASYIIRAEKEIKDMSDLVNAMFSKVSVAFEDRSPDYISGIMPGLKQQEDYADQMKEQLTKYIIGCSRLPLSEKQGNHLSIMQQNIVDLEEMTDECFNMAFMLEKANKKDLKFHDKDMAKLLPYLEEARKLQDFICQKMNMPLSQDELKYASELETSIDATRKALKKTARKRLEDGADVKAELLYIDLVRQIEKFGDRAFSISESLSQL